MSMLVMIKLDIIIVMVRNAFFWIIRTSIWNQTYNILWVFWKKKEHLLEKVINDNDLAVGIEKNDHLNELGQKHENQNNNAMEPENDKQICRDWCDDDNILEEK